MKYLSLFSGIEAATVAWGSLGWTPVAFSETAKFPRTVLNYHYPNVPNLGDITKVEGKKYAGMVDLVVGGTPCEDFSQGTRHRAGLDGTRSGLAREYIRLIREIVPQWLVWENVPGCLQTNGGRDFKKILVEMDECGYGVAGRVLNAQYFGVPQCRKRVYLVGYRGALAPAGAVLFERESLSGNTGTGRAQGKNHTGRIRANNEENSGERRIVRQAMSCKWAKQSSGPSGDECHNLIVDDRGLRRFTLLECERLQGFPDGYTDIPGASDTQRYIALGNSMAVPVMKWLGERIEKVNKELEQC